MEAALAGWQQRYEQERVEQGFFASEAEAFKHGCVRVCVYVYKATYRPRLTPPVSFSLHSRILVRLTVVEASALPPLKDTQVQGASDDYAGLKGTGTGGKKILPSVNLRPVGGGGGVSGGEKERVASHPFVAVTLERPRPLVGLLVGHTNTEYGTQAPVFGRNAQVKACPHGGKLREAFVPAGAARVVATGAGVAGQQAFLFYAPKVRNL